MTDLTQLVLANNNLSSMVPMFQAFVTVDTHGKDLINSTTLNTRLPEEEANSCYRGGGWGSRVNDEHVEMGERGSPRPEVIEGVLLTSNGIHRLNIDFSVAMEALTNPCNIFLKTQFSTYYKAIMPSGSRYIDLAFLHGSTSGPILLLDLSSKSILLKSLMEPQVGDIEVYKVIDPSKSTGSLSAVAGSVGYIPPKYAYTMIVTMAGNIYSFGVILLELVTGKAGVSEGIELAKWVSSKSTRKGKWDHILDYSSTRYRS
ncbi:hypothetical protein LguiA_004788 [Lonicera macranthoides]